MPPGEQLFRVSSTRAADQQRFFVQQGAQTDARARILGVGWATQSPWWYLVSEAAFLYCLAKVVGIITCARRWNALLVLMQAIGNTQALNQIGRIDHSLRPHYVWGEDAEGSKCS